MAEVKIEDIIDHLDYEMKRALEDAVEEVLPNVSFDRDDLFRAFKSAVYRKCNTWERVPNHFVKA